MISLLVNNIQEPNMYTAEQEARQYLRNRASDIELKREMEFRKHFNQEYTYPKDYQQALDWEKRGGLKVKVYKELEYDRYDEVLNFGWDVTWENPDKPRDDEGYKACKKLLKEAYIATKDAIVVGDPKEGLKAVQEFEGKTFH